MHRFKSLVLIGCTQQGKTTKAFDIFGYEQTFKVSCQGLSTGLIPSLRDFDRKVHKCIIWDEARYDQVVNNKEVFMSCANPVALQQSACNQHVFHKWLYQTAHILCSNKFPTTIEDGVSADDVDWLKGNLVIVSLPVGQTWYL
jgi:hypothetical protein